MDTLHSYRSRDAIVPRLTTLSGKRFASGTRMGPDMKNCKRRSQLALWAVAICAAGPAMGAHDHSSGVFAAFLSVEARQQSQDGPEGDSGTELVPTADLLLNLHNGRWRFLTEFVVSDDEHEFERLQLGYELVDNSVLWLGRFHQPASVWNIFYHHGQYLQTSISRPWIESWEDESGPLPQHITGALFESLIPLEGGGAWRVAAGVGLAPTLVDDRLEPHNVFDGDEPKDPHASLRLEWLPDQLGENTLGLVASHSEVAVVRDDSLFGSKLRIQTLGGFFSLEASQLRAVASLNLIRTDGLGSNGSQQESHFAGYLQGEYSPIPAVTIFARHEFIDSESESAYIALFPDSPSHRTLGGARWQVSPRNALSMEVSHNRTVDSRSFNEARMQWSAVVP